MNKTFALTKVLLKSGSLWTTGASRKNQKFKQLVPVLLIVLLIPFFLMITSYVSNLYTMFEQFGEPSAILALGITLTSAVIFMFGLFYIINVFYFSQDINPLLPLPLKAGEILSAKFLVTLLYEYYTSFLILGPLFYVYGTKSGAGIDFYLFAMIVFLFVPVIPLVMASFLAMIFMRFSSFAKSKERFRMIGGLLAVAFAIGFQFIVQKFNTDSLSENDMMQRLVEGDIFLFDLVSKLFPAAKLAAEPFVQSSIWTGIASIVLLIGVSALSYFLFLWIGKAMYFQGVMGMSETTARREQLTKEQLDEKTIQSSALMAYTLREIRLLIRTPVYFMNGILTIFIIPVVVCIPIFTQPDFVEVIRTFISEIEMDSQLLAYVLVIGFGVMMFIAATNAVAPTVISREGRSLFVTKYLPVPYSTFMLSKFIVSYALFIISVLLVLLVLLFAFQISIGILALILFVSALGGAFITLTGMLIDLYSPKLYWDSEQKAMKQNMNVVLNMLVGIIFAAIVMIPTFVFEWNFWTVFSLLTGGSLLLIVLTYRIVVTRCERWLEPLDL